MQKFHAQLSALKCTTCSEPLPGLHLPLRRYQFLQFCTSCRSVYTRAEFYSINLHQDIGLFVTSLPRPCPVSIVVRKEGATQSHCDFHVEGYIMLSALQCLLVNNCCDNIGIVSDAPTLLPENSDLTHWHIQL